MRTSRFHLARRRLVSLGVAGALLLCIASPLAGIGLAAPADDPIFVNCDVDSSQLVNSAYETALLSLINQYRADNGADALQPDYLLIRAALWKSYEMPQVVAAGGPVKHDDTFPSRTWQQRFADCGYLAIVPQASFSENVDGGDETAAEAFASFQHSPLHNANMLNPDFRYVGIKRVMSPIPNDTYTWYWTVTFGSDSTQDLGTSLVAQPS